MAKELTAEEQAEKARVETFQKQAAADRAKEEAIRAARANLAKKQESIIVHGPVR